MNEQPYEIPNNWRLVTKVFRGMLGTGDNTEQPAII